MNPGPTPQPPAEGPTGPERLSDEEIEAILAQEAEAPSPESGAPPPLTVAQRQPGEGRFGKWVVWLIIAFILLSAWQVIRR